MKKAVRLANPAIKRNPVVKAFRKHWMLYSMALPAVILLIVFNYLPMVGIVMAFQDLDYSKGIFTSPFVGLKNFEFLFASSMIWDITRNTIIYNVAFIIVNTVLSVGLALMINELTNKTFAKVIQTILIMPFFLSTVVLAMIVYAFLAYNYGFANTLLKGLGLDPQNWYNMPDFWPGFLIFVNAWRGIGFSSVTYTAVISGISQEYYEAATLDGASRWQQIRYITLPHLKTILCINLINAVGGMFRSDFGLFYTVTRNSGALYSTTQTLDVYIYNALQSMTNLGMTTAAGLYQSVVGFILVLVANKIIKTIDSDSAMF